jgi:biopolymer transport protein ExbD
MSSGGGKRPKLQQQDDHLDLVPLIDCVFLLLLFFMICGRLSTDQRTEQISVPPTKTAVKFDGTKAKWRREIINVFGATQTGDPPSHTIRIGTTQFKAKGNEDYSAYQQLRSKLDKIYDESEKYDDPKATGMKLPKVIVEIRADANTEFRVVQEVQQVLTDGFDLEKMQPKKNFDPKQGKPFVNLDFTTRKHKDQN